MEVESGSVVFLDRDGTINFNSGYVCDPAEVLLLPGAADGIAALRALGYTLIVVSNQSAVGRGMATTEAVEATNRQVQKLLLEENPGAMLDLWCYAPDHPDSATDLRKPGIGMLRTAQRHYQVTLESSWMIGDALSDIGFGLNAGIPARQCVLLADERPPMIEGEGEEPILVMPSLAAAAVHIADSLHQEKAAS